MPGTKEAGPARQEPTEEEILGWVDAKPNPEKPKVSENGEESVSMHSPEVETEINNSKNIAAAELKRLEGEQKEIKDLINHSDGLSKEDKNKLLENKRKKTREILTQQCLILGINPEDEFKTVDEENLRQLDIAFKASYGTERLETQQAQETLMLVKNPKLLDARYDAIINSKPSFLTDEQMKTLCDPKKNGTAEIRVGTFLNSVLLNKEDVAILSQAGLNVNQMKRGWLGFSNKISFGETEFPDVEGLNKFIESEKNKYIIQEAKKRLELRKQKTIDENIEQSVLDMESARLAKEIEEQKGIGEAPSRKSGGNWRDALEQYTEDKSIESSSSGIRSNYWQENYLKKVKKDEEEANKTSYNRLYDEMTSSDSKIETMESVKPPEPAPIVELTPAPAPENPKPPEVEKKTPEQIKEESYKIRKESIRKLLLSYSTNPGKKGKRIDDRVDKIDKLLNGDLELDTPEGMTPGLDFIEKIINDEKKDVELKGIPLVIKPGKSIDRIIVYIESTLDAAKAKIDEINILSPKELESFSTFIGKYEKNTKDDPAKVKITQIKAKIQEVKEAIEAKKT